MKTNSLLTLFNNFTFTSAAQSLLSALDSQELKNLLAAIEDQPKYRQLTQLVRARIFVDMAEEVDRSFYFTHYEEMDMVLLREQRGNMVARQCSRIQLKIILQKYGNFFKKGQSLFEEKFEQIRSALFEPQLQLPPVRRETVAPNCQTVYQIVLACRALSLEDEQESLLPGNQETLAFFFEGLSLQIEIASSYLSSLTEDFQHFAELTYRFMLYRNTVLSLHNLSPFPVLSKAMTLWSFLMQKHYKRANKVFVKMMGLGGYEQFIEHGLLSGDELKQEGYMIDYVEGLVDLSIDEKSVGFCGHSRQMFGAQYQMLEKEVLNSALKLTECSLDEVREKIAEWKDEGVKPCTLSKICSLFEGTEGSDEIRETLCCGQDDFIQTCARINGLILPSQPLNLHEC